MAAQTWSVGEVLLADDLNAVPKGIVGLASQTSSQGSLGAGPTAITGLSITVTITSGRYYRLTHYCQGLSSSADPETWSVQLLDGSTQVQERNIAITESGTGQGGGVCEYLFQAGSSGSKTYLVKVARATGSGTGTHLCSSTAPARIVLEDLGT